MTKTTLVYLGTEIDSKYGLLRGCIAIIPLLFVFIIIACLYKNSKVTGQ